MEKKKKKENVRAIQYAPVLQVTGAGGETPTTTKTSAAALLGLRVSWQLHRHCETSVGKVIAGSQNSEACTESLCLSPQDFGLCIPGREVNNVSGCRGLGTTRCRALLRPGRIGRLFIKCPESLSLTLRTGLKDKL